MTSDRVQHLFSLLILSVRLKKKKKQTNKQNQLFRRSLRRRRSFDLQSWTKWMGDLSPPPSSPLNQEWKMAWFGFCAALSLTWEGDGGLLVHFILSKIAIFKKKKIFLSKIVSFESKTNYRHWSTRTNSAVWQVPYACAQPITLAVAAMDSCFSLIGAHQHVVSKNGRTRVSKTLYCRVECKRHLHRRF